jgi:hypothetical protein
MNETHLEQPETLRATIEELSEAIGDITTIQELRHKALAMAIGCFLKPSPNGENIDIIAMAETFYKFLSADDSDQGA